MMTKLSYMIDRVMGKKWIFISVLFAVLSLTPYPLILNPEVYAAPLTDESTLELGPDKAPQAAAAGQTLFASMVKLFSGLAVVIGVLLVVYYFIREHFGKINKVSGKGKLINVVATHYLAPKKAVMLIEVAGECLVVGVGEEINLLARIENLNQGPGFSDALKEATERESSLGVIDSIKGRLESLKGKR